MPQRWRVLAFLAVGLIAAGESAAQSQSDATADNSADETYSLHGQITIVDQYHPAFRAPYSGTDSLNPGSRGMETIAATLFTGVRLWDGGQLYADPEIDQGFGLSNTFGIAAFPSGEAYKVGDTHAYGRLQQLFFRQVIDLGGSSQTIDPGANQLGMNTTSDNITITAGKFGVNAVFDTNTYAHDPTSDFLNWALIDSGAFDYAADAWGYTYGTSVEWTQSWWTLRTGVFALSRVPNSKELQTDFRQFELDGEAEGRFDIVSKKGKIKLLGFLNRARMGSYDDAVRLAEATGTIPATSAVRKYNSRTGIALNLEQPLTDDLGAFLRLSFNNGDEEVYEFTEINESAAGGISLTGARWGRADDTVGVAGIVDGISNAARRYFAAGGLGTLIGDGRLRYATEDVLEVYYSVQAAKWFAATLDYQFVANPAYNSDRGPVSVFALRLHGSF